jgi:hypothetical protein
MKEFNTDIRDNIYRTNIFSCDLIELHLATPKYLCNGGYDIAVDTPTAPDGGINTYTAQGDFIGFSTIAEDFDVKVGKLSVYLSGVTSLINDFVDQEVAGRRVTVYRCFLDITDGSVVGTPVLLFDGQIQGVSISETSRTCSITVDVSSLFADFERIAGRMTNNESNWLFQGQRYDTTFEKTGMLRHTEVKWGRL